MRRVTKESIGEYLDEAIYGANDGIITTFAVISAGTGATLGNDAIIIVGLANLLADGFSMGASSFLSIKTEEDVQRKKPIFYFLRRRKSDALRRSSVTFWAFLVAGSMPLIPFLTPYANGKEFVVSAIAAGASFLFVGGIRTLITKKGFVKSGLEMLLIGGTAAGIAFTIGAVVQSILS